MIHYQILTELFLFCAHHKIEFLVTTDENPNTIFYNEKDNIVCLQVSDEDDEKLGNMIEELLKELQQLFQ